MLVDSQFWYFWWRNCVEGWHTGHWIVGALEGLCLVVTIVLRLRKANHYQQKVLEECAMRWTWKLFLIGFIFSTILCASFQQWYEAEQSRERLQALIEDKSARLDGFIDQNMIWTEPGTTNTIVVLQLSVNNSGGAASIAEAYKLKVVLTNKTSIEGKPIDIAEQYSWKSLNSNTLTIYKLKRADLIGEKTSAAIQPGNGARGWLAYRLPDVLLNNISRTNFSMIVSFLDVNNRAVFVTNGLWKGKAVTGAESEEFPRTLPGSGNLVDTNIQLAAEIDIANWQPPEMCPDCTNVSIIFGNQVFNIPKWQAEVPPDNTITQVPISDIPDSAITDLEKLPNYSPRLKSVFAKGSGMQTAFGDKPITYPFWPFVVSNRLYLYVQMPFLSGLRKLAMNDSFDSSLPNAWDRNYGTNLYAYEIVNENKQPVLQVAYSKPNEILIDGIFVSSSNSLLKAFLDPPQLITLGYKAIDLATQMEITNLSLDSKVFSATETNTLAEMITNTLYDMTFSNQHPIFRYPSNRRNIGVFAN